MYIRLSDMIWAGEERICIGRQIKSPYGPKKVAGGDWSELDRPAEKLIKQKAGVRLLYAIKSGGRTQD
jgi:hypothetical protein